MRGFTVRLWSGLVWATLATAAAAQVDPEELRSAKALYFDGKYTEARAAWRWIGERAGGDESDLAAFWVARCSEKLEEDDRAFREYGEYLALEPGDATLVEEARTSRVGLAARLYQAGQTKHLPFLHSALEDKSTTVRYYAAFRLANLGAKAGRPAVPVLKGILASEADPDLVDRARLALLRLDPGALAGAERGKPSAEPSRTVRWIKLRIQERGSADPKVSLSLPVGLAELVFRSLPEEARGELRSKGYDVDNFWERLKRLGPTEILKIESDDGDKIEIWLE